MIDKVVAAHRVRKYLGDMDVDIHELYFEPYKSKWRAEIYKGRRKVGEVLVDSAGIICSGSSSVKSIEERL